MIKPRSFVILQRALEEGIQLGLNRAEEADEPTREYTEKCLYDAIMLNVCEMFNFDDIE